MRHLVILVHADPSVRGKYEAALEGLDADLVVVNSPYGAFSSAYSRLAAELKTHRGSLLDALCRRGGVSRKDYDACTLVTFSAGYALARTLLTEQASFAELDGYVALDSIHSGVDADGTPADHQLVGFVRQALAACDGPRVCWIGHTDVDPVKYASTTDTAEEIRRLAIERRSAEREKIELMGLMITVGKLDAYETGGFRIESYDESKSARVEHGLALTGWGPDFVARAVTTLERRMPSPVPDTERTMPDLTLGERALAIALGEMDDGVKEIPGTTHTPRILEYFAPCERDGRIIGDYLSKDEFAWCAAAACFCGKMASARGGPVPHRYRASVREIWSDMITSGYAISARQIREGEYAPYPGDLLILTRGGPATGSSSAAFSKTKGQGHVGRIITSDMLTVTTVDGNVGDTWTKVTRRWSDPTVVGVGAYPRPGIEPMGPGLDALHVLASLPRVGT